MAEGASLTGINMYVFDLVNRTSATRAPFDLLIKRSLKSSELGRAESAIESAGGFATGRNSEALECGVVLDGHHEDGEDGASQQGNSAEHN